MKKERQVHTAIHRAIIMAARWEREREMVIKTIVTNDLATDGGPVNAVLIDLINTERALTWAVNYLRRIMESEGDGIAFALYEDAVNARKPVRKAINRINELLA